MAVIIHNVSERYGLKYGKDLQMYDLRINNKTLCTFSHIYEEGLVVCLREAAKWLEDLERMNKEIEKLSGGKE